MPDVVADLARAVDLPDLRVFLIDRRHHRVAGCQIPELARKRDLAVSVELLIVEEQHLVLEQQTPHLGAPVSIAARGLPLIVGIILVLPLGMLLVNSFNVAPAGQQFKYGIGNWQAAFADPSSMGALWNSLALSITRTAISLPIALVLVWLIARSDMPGRNLVEILAWLSI